MKAFKILGLFLVAVFAILAPHFLFAGSVTMATIAILPGMSVENMEKYAEEHFSSFEGENNFEGDFYTGYNDTFVDFGGPGMSFANEIQTQRIFTYTITSTDNANNLGVYLFGGLDRSRDGIVVEGAFKSIEGKADKLNASGQPYSINIWIEFIRTSPVAIPVIKVKTNTNDQQIDQNIFISEESPFRKSEERILYPGNYESRQDTNNKFMLFDTQNLIASNQTIVRTVILPLQTVQYTFYCGGIANNAVTLANKRHKAVTNINMVGGASQVAQAQQIASKKFLGK